MRSGTAATPKSSAPREVLIQLTLVTFLVTSFIWIGRHAFAGSKVVFAVLLILILLWSHRRRGDSLRAIGFRLDTAPRTVLSFAPIAIAIITLTLAVGLWMHSLRFPPIPAALYTLAKLLLFGIAQQYVLLGFYHRGIARLVPAPLAAVLITALLFAAFHVPNPFLMVVTFFAAVIATLIYRYSPNLWVNGITHGIVSFALYYSLPVSVTGGLRVGPEY
jgi:membrane protease YdiL (CAAX protease family)